MEASGFFQFLPHPRYSEIDVCASTGVHRFRNASLRDYGSGYFLDEYRKQYNKTYFEDEKNLRRLARERLQLVSECMGWQGRDWKGKWILEIGSATGFFLHEASMLSDFVLGVEISQEAAEYGRDVLGLDIRVGNFLDESIVSSNLQFDLIFSFFTLEHIPDIEMMWKKIARLLAKDGMIFLSLPSFYGPTFQTNPSHWFHTHPQDHFYDYSPESLKKVLNHYGIIPIYRKPLSYHKERDKGWKGFLPDYLYRKIADRTCYGDTFQILAKKWK